MPSQRFRQQGWDQWGVFRDASVVSCMEYTDPAEVCSSAREEGGTVEEVCPDAMPPTGVSAFEYHLPVNNKWRTKYPIYDRHTINDPEYLMDVVLDYHMRHDLSIYLSIYLAVCLSVYLSIYLSIYRYIYMCVCVYIYRYIYV